VFSGKTNWLTTNNKRRIYEKEERHILAFPFDFNNEFKSKLVSANQ
jgi:hypothetical protein